MVTINLPKSDFASVVRLWRAILGAPLQGGELDPSRLILWAPMALATGSALYFALPFEPSGSVLAAAGFGGAMLGGVILFRTRAIMRLYAIGLLACFVLGFGLAQSRTQALAPPDLSAFAQGRVVSIEGWIETVERLDGRARVLIRPTQIEGLSIPPKRIRVRVGLEAYMPGDAVRFRARLSPPGAPVASGGYDPARAAWFDQVGLTGFAMTALDPIALTGEAEIHRALAKFRWRLSQRIHSAAGPETGAIAAALLTGERAAVSEDDAEALRLSGLGHILAISGLHMALFAGGVYWLARLVLAGVDRYARAHDPRYPAAWIALTAATFYLMLSGAAVSTQRAYVMAVVVLLGVLLKRRGFSLRSLALAALVVLVIAPESIIEPGFQMSFSAVAALIATYDIWTRWRAGQWVSRSWINRIWGAFAGLASTSLIAGAATGAFAAIHFQRMAAYGMIANLAAMPIFTFWVMPAGGAALAMSAVGLEAPFLWVMDKGLQLVLAIAHWTAGLEGAGVGVLAAPPLLVALYGGGFALMTLGLGWTRLTGLIVTVLALGLFTQLSPPQMMVSDNGVVLARFEASPDTYTVTDRRRGRFDSRVFLQRVGLTHTPERAQLRCDDLGCTGLTVEGLSLAVTDRPEALEEDCGNADLIIFRGEASPWRKRRCAAVLLDDPAREALGGAEFWVEQGQVIRMRTAQDGRRNRIWARPQTQT